ncbi:hypothetical protein B0H66DRAFT_643669 [Apodospora peruviana]|uniref:Fungal N-terminal domain-containing protein n=1 Tax=Apodospora peruviana TaxID=516989 RepID=A0AAE0HWR6_9PEZI|nr:hypothetical protein B0H66DRAFT_643669 [Apodospora peruviana]
MEPVSIIGLVGACVGITSRAASLANEIDDFVRIYRNGDKSIAKLANSLRIFAEAVRQLRVFLDNNPTVSDDLSSAIGSSLADCDDIVQSLEDHIRSLTPPSDHNKRMGFTSKIKHIWTRSAVSEEEQALHSQLQTVMLLVNLVKQNDSVKQNNALAQANSKNTLARSSRHARSVREARDMLSVAPMLSTDETFDTQTIGAELAIDEQLLRSAPYVATYRAMLRRELARAASESLIMRREESPGVRQGRTASVNSYGSGTDMKLSLSLPSVMKEDMEWLQNHAAPIPPSPAVSSIKTEDMEWLLPRRARPPSPVELEASFPADQGFKFDKRTSHQLAPPADGTSEFRVMSDSPAAVEFTYNIFDRAFGEEVERMKQSRTTTFVLPPNNLGEIVGTPPKLIMPTSHPLERSGFTAAIQHWHSKFSYKPTTIPLAVHSKD